MGAYAPGNDATLDEAIVRREEMLDFLRQTPTGRVTLEESRNALAKGFGA
jgi:flagellum-specific ATP synthase